MKPDIAYVYNKLKQLRFEFKESDRKLFPNEYTFDYGLDRYVRVDGNDLYISKDTFKPLEEELEYADKCHKLEEQIGCPLDVIAKLRETRTCYTYTSMASSDVETLTKCDVLGLDVCDTLFMVGYDVDGGYVCDHELKFNEYGIKWWLEPGVLPKYRKVEE